jgi:hypothetical protein
MVRFIYSIILVLLTAFAWGDTTKVSLSLPGLSSNITSIAQIQDQASAQKEVEKLKGLKLLSVITLPKAVLSIDSNLINFSGTTSLHETSYTIGKHLTFGNSILDFSMSKVPKKKGSLALSGSLPITTKDSKTNISLNFDNSRAVENLTYSNKTTSIAIHHDASTSLNLNYATKVLTLSMLHEKTNIVNFNYLGNKTFNFSGTNLMSTANRQVVLAYDDKRVSMTAREGLNRSIDLAYTGSQGMSISSKGLGGKQSDVSLILPKLLGIGILQVSSSFGTASNINRYAFSSVLMQKININFQRIEDTTGSHNIVAYSLINVKNLEFGGSYTEMSTKSYNTLHLKTSIGGSGGLGLQYTELPVSKIGGANFQENISKTLTAAVSYTMTANTASSQETVGGSLHQIVSKSCDVSIGYVRNLGDLPEQQYNTATFYLSNKINNTNYITLSTKYADSLQQESRVDLSWKAVF